MNSGEHEVLNHGFQMVPFKCADKLVLESTNQPNKLEGLGDDDFEFVFNVFYKNVAYHHLFCWL